MKISRIDVQIHIEHVPVPITVEIKERHPFFLPLSGFAMMELVANGGRMSRAIENGKCLVDDCEYDEEDGTGLCPEHREDEAIDDEFYAMKRKLLTEALTPK